MTALAELDSLIELLERQIPASQQGNERLRKDLEGDMEKYFRKLEKAFSYGKVDRIYNKYVEAE